MDNNKTLIKNRKKVELGQSQVKMIISGWGEYSYNNSVVEDITYISDGLKVKGYLAYPLNAGDKKLPCIIWNRGGYYEKGAIDHFTAKGIYGTMASWGYVVLASQYRGNAGSEGNDEIGGRDVNDILNLIPLADEIPFADTTKWGMEGWSRGGMMTYLTLLKNSNFKCAVLTGAISDLKSYAEKSEWLAPSFRKAMGDEKYNYHIGERTIIDRAEKLPDIPYLLLHGGSDQTVPAVQTIKMAKRFYELNYKYRLVIFEEGDHFLRSHRKEVDELRKMWYEKYLGS